MRVELANPKLRKYFLPRIMNSPKFSPDHFGYITSPAIGNPGSAISKIKKGFLWICDNGAFSGNFNPDDFFSFLENLIPYQRNCHFIVSPDKYQNAKETNQMFKKYAPKIKSMGFPVAFVAQNGQEKLKLPSPDQFDALFVGGSDSWKMSNSGETVIKAAQQMGKSVHIGRVNSLKRIRFFSVLNVDSFDGTHVIYGPQKNGDQLLKWMKESINPLFYL